MAVDDRLIFRSVPQHDSLALGATLWRLTFSPDGAWLAASAGDGTVRVWETETFRQEYSLPRLSLDSSHLGTFCFGPQSNRIAIGEADGRIRVFELPSSECTYDRSVGDSPITAMTFSADGERLLAPGPDESVVTIWDMRGKELGSLTGHRAPITCMAFLPRAQTETLVTASRRDHSPLGRSSEKTAGTAPRSL